MSCGQEKQFPTFKPMATRQALRALGRTPLQVAETLRASGVQEPAMIEGYTSHGCIVALYMNKVTGKKHANDGTHITRLYDGRLFRLPNAVRDFVQLRDDGWLNMATLRKSA